MTKIVHIFTKQSGSTIGIQKMSTVKVVLLIQNY